MRYIKTTIVIVTLILACFLGRGVKLPISALAVDEQNKEFATTAEAMVIMETSTGRMLAAKDENKKLPMASLTKIITAIVAIEKTENLDEALEIPKSAQGVEGSSIYLKAGEHLTMRELLYGLMLRSGNDAAVAISMLASGTTEKFIEECNSFCQKLNMTNTHLVTPSGLHDDNHYSSAKDLAIVTSYALKNDIFARIVSTKETTISNEKGEFDHRLLKNKNKFLKNFAWADGVKTGYTKKAGRCFVGSATKDDMQVVCVLLNCRPMFEECKTLCEEAFTKYSLSKIVDDNFVAQTEIDGNTLYAKPNKELYYPLTQEEIGKLEINTEFDKNIELPIMQKQKVGTVQIFLDKTIVLCDNIYSINDIEDNSYQSALDKVISKF